MKKYGREFPKGTSALDIELWMFRHDPRGDYEGGRLSSYDHYKNIVDIIWNNKDSVRRHIHHAWGERMIREIIGEREHKRFLGIAGNSSSGKSDLVGLYCLVEYLSAPTETLCLLTSTTIEMAKLRIWKSVREYSQQLVRYFELQGQRPPLKAVHSKCVIRGVDAMGDFTDATGLRLIAADKQKGEEATSKVMGSKAPGMGKVILAADELTDLSPNILTVAYTNLVNNYKFTMVGIANPNLLTDPFGRFCKPKNGWDSVSHEPDEWETERGKVIRFDSERSPRVQEEDDWSDADKATKTPTCFWMPGRDVIEAAAKQYGRKSRYFYRMYRGMFCPDQEPNAIYSEVELLRSSDAAEPEWDRPDSLVRVSGLDCAFTSNGDRSVSVELLCGRVKGRKHVHVAASHSIHIDDKKELSPSHQVVRKWKDRNIQMGVKPERAGFDNSGAGISFGHIVTTEWSPVVCKIAFGGAPSGRMYSLDGDTAIEFANRVSELWVQPKKYFRAGQITGITPDIVEELVSRQYDDSSDSRKLKVEPKKKLKIRTGKSPDAADAFVLALEVAIQGGLLDSAEEKAIIQHARKKFASAKRKLGMRSPNQRTRHLKF